VNFASTDRLDLGVFHPIYPTGSPSMSSRLRIALATAALALMFSENPVTARAQQKLVTADQAQIVDKVSTIFTAALTDDVAKFDSVIASDFYIFDGGARFNGDSIMAFIKAQHLAGKRYEWNVTEPDVHISGNTAWVAYVNKGSITDASGHREPELAGISLPPEAGRCLEDRLHAQHPHAHGNSREPWQTASKLRLIIFCRSPHGTGAGKLSVSCGG
jgi:hypothetical protein